jgi:hypothetical protein
LDLKILLWTFPGAMLLKKKKNVTFRKQVVSIKEGQLLLFRGDLVHAGSQYSSLNHRLHFYLDSSLCDRASDGTQHITNGTYVNISD